MLRSRCGPARTAALVLVYAGLLYVVVCWGLNAVLVKSAIARFDPLAFAALRFVVMTPLVFAMVYSTGNRIRFRREDLVLLVVCAAFGYGIYQFLWMLSLANTTAFATSLLGATAPVFTLIVVALLGHEKVEGARWLGAGVALLGIAIFEGAFAGHATFRTGDLLALLSSLSFAGYNVTTARLIDRYSPIALVAITMTMGTLMILPVGLPRVAHTDFTQFGWDVWGPFIFAVIFPIVLTWPVWNYGISRIGAARVGLFGFLVPIVTGISSALILHAGLEPHQLAGAAICLAGMAVATIFGHYSLGAIWAERTQPLER